MKKTFTIILLITSSLLFGQFDAHFEKATLRMDYIRSGNHDTELPALIDFKKEPHWAGSLTNLTEHFEYGHHFLRVRDAISAELLYSRGYGSLFNEWSHSDEAKELYRSYEETVVMPFPRKKVIITLYSRNIEKEFEEVFRIDFDPEKTYFQTKNDNEAPVIEIQKNGPPEKSVDIVILPEGYTESELGLFINDCHSLVSSIFSFEPYTKLQDKFNAYAVWAPSEESGSDSPNDGIEVNTTFKSSFNTFGYDRYCMSMSIHTIRDYAANAPYDQIYILVNSEKHGGGAIYNFYSLSTSRSLRSPKVFVHEFGHSFAGLADEYAFENDFVDMHNTGSEPWEANISNMTDFDSKWKHMISADTPVPTPATSNYRNVVGAFEGAGYMMKGMFRPEIDCLMRSFSTDKFCAVCTKTIEKMVKFYTE